MKINNDWGWAEPKNSTDWTATDTAWLFLILGNLLGILMGLFVALPWALTMLLGLGLPFVKAASAGNASAVLGSKWVYVRTSADYYAGHARSWKYEQSNRDKLWKFYKSLHEDVRADIGVLTWTDFKDLPENEANKMRQVFDDLETAYWDNRRALPDPKISNAFENAKAATNIYEAMTKELQN